MPVLLQRLAVPFVLLAAVIGTSVAIERVGNEDLPAEAGGQTVTDTLETPVFSVRRVPTLLTSPRANEELASALGGWIATLPPTTCFVASAGGEVVFSHQPDIPLTPASNMKILTAYAALEELGPDHRFVTSIQAVVPPDANGFLAGDLYVIGGGDPVLETNAYAAVAPPTDDATHTSADELADQTVAANIVDISGAVLVDESRYDTVRAVDSWPVRFLEQGQSGPLSAALLDDGFLGLADGYASQVGVEDPPPLRRAEDPAAQFAASFDDLLEARNVRIAQRAARVDELPAGLVELTSISSPPLSQIVAKVLTNSDNTAAELLTKELGVARSDQGSTTAGTLALSDLLRIGGLVDTGLFAVDGSGLSSENKATCSLVHAALDDGDHKEVLRAGMPVAGQTGTLSDAFLGTPFEGRLRAKTGFLGQVSALSGYFVTDRGVEVTFALIVNVGTGTEITEEMIAQWQAPLPGILAPYPVGPPIEELGPLGVTTVGAGG